MQKFLLFDCPTSRVSFTYSVLLVVKRNHVAEERRQKGESVNFVLGR